MVVNTKHAPLKNIFECGAIYVSVYSMFLYARLF